jgi:hypothetical protein
MNNILSTGIHSLSFAAIPQTQAKVPAVGEFDLAYDAGEACWKAEYDGPRVKSGAD